MDKRAEWQKTRACEGVGCPSARLRGRVEMRKRAGSAGHESKLSSAEGCGIWEGVACGTSEELAAASV